MAIKSNYAIAISVLIDCLKNVAPSFNQGEVKPITPCKHVFPHALRKLQVISRTSDWLIAMFAPVILGWSNNF